jgi:hypothetical protein
MTRAGTVVTATLRCEVKLSLPLDEGRQLAPSLTTPTRVETERLNVFREPGRRWPCVYELPDAFVCESEPWSTHFVQDGKALG